MFMSGWTRTQAQLCESEKYSRVRDVATCIHIPVPEEKYIDHISLRETASASRIQRELPVNLQENCSHRNLTIL